jgi:hypothetical protein
MGDGFVANAHDGNSRAQFLPRLLACHLMREFLLHDSHIRENSFRIHMPYGPLARDGLACQIGAQSRSAVAAQELVVALFIPVDAPTAQVLTSGSCVPEMIRMASEARFSDFELRTN